jgi:hypothetical protein
MKENEPGEGMVFSDMGEVHHALDASKVVTLHTKIKGRFKTSTKTATGSRRSTRRRLAA